MHMHQQVSFVFKKVGHSLMNKRLLAEGKLFFAVTTLEFINLACSIYNLLFPGIKRMAVGAHVNVH